MLLPRGSWYVSMISVHNHSMLTGSAAAELSGGSGGRGRGGGPPRVLGHGDGCRSDEADEGEERQGELHY